MSKLLFAGNRMDSVKLISGTPADTASFAWFDPVYAASWIWLAGGDIECTFYDPASAPLLVPYDVVAGHSAFIHAIFGWGDGGDAGSNILLQVQDDAGVPWVRLNRTGAVIYLEYWNGTVWTALGSTPLIGYSSSTDLDLKIDVGAGGAHHAQLILNRAISIGPFAFSATGMTNLRSFRWGANGHTYLVGQMLATEDQSTVGAKVATTRATGAGSNSGWTGAYTDVNENLVDDTTNNQATAAGLKQSYPMGDVTVPVGYTIAGVFQWLRAKNDGSAPANIQSICRSAGADYVSADVNGMGIAYGSVGARYDVDPATLAAWTQTNYNAVELGFESAT